MIKSIVSNSNKLVKYTFSKEYQLLSQNSISVTLNESLSRTYAHRFKPKKHPGYTGEVAPRGGDIRTFKAITPSLRHTVLIDKRHYPKDPFSPLVDGRRENRAGRNHSGSIKVRRRGGGHKRRYRNVDLDRNEDNNVPMTVQRIEYDPNRSTPLALVYLGTGVFKYIQATAGMKVGQVVHNRFTEVDINPDYMKQGDRSVLKYIPLKTMICQVETTPTWGSTLARAGGTFATIVNKNDTHVALQMSSGGYVMVPIDCRATLGRNAGGNRGQKLGKAGRKRRLGKRPAVCGVSMNTTDHPHGGGVSHKNAWATPRNWKGRPQATKSRPDGVPRPSLFHPGSMKWVWEIKEQKKLAKQKQRMITKKAQKLEKLSKKGGKGKKKQ